MTKYILPLITAFSLAACTSSSAPQKAETAVATTEAPEKAKDAVVVPMPSKALDTSAALTRIAFGSCLSEEEDQTIWTTLQNEDSDLFLFLGDNVYGDAYYKDEEFKDPTMPKMRRSYAKLATHQTFTDFRAVTPMLTTWDDHDYGANDAGVDYPFKALAKDLYLTAWNIPADDERRQRDGVHTSKINLRLIASSIQVHAEGHGWEAWRTLPHERERFYNLIKTTGANDVILLSGDRHAGALYKREGLYELTASSLNLPASKWRAERGDTSIEAGPYRVGDMQHEVNYGLIDIDWAKREAMLTLRSPGGEDITQNIPF